MIKFVKSFSRLPESRFLLIEKYNAAIDGGTFQNEIKIAVESAQLAAEAAAAADKEKLRTEFAAREANLQSQLATVKDHFNKVVDDAIGNLEKLRPIAGGA